MLFNSYIFIFLFLPLVLTGWHGLNHFKKYKAAQCIVISMSLWFYGYFNYYNLILILCSISVNWLISKKIEREEKNPDGNEKIKKIFGIIGILFNIGFLFYFKYYDFFIENCNTIFKTEWALKNIALPLGISFYTFQQISFIADRMTGKASHYHIVDYAMYVVYFPQLIAGPIVSHDDLIPQFWEEKRRKFDWDYMLRGIRLFVIGLAKKVLLADELGKLVGYGFEDVNALDSPSALIVMLACSFQLFFDFSGYSDMALGLASMMHLDLPLNFNSPFKACSVKELWGRWHITLNTFWVKYVYIPLGGNRKGKFRKYCNSIIVFLLSGFWHGANWTFVLWGVVNGVLVSLEDMVREWREKRESTRRMFIGEKKIRWFLTFASFNLGVVLFSSSSVGETWSFYKRLFSFSNTGYISSLAGCLFSYKTYPLHLILDKLGGYNLSSKLYIVWMLFFLCLAAFLCTKPNARDWVNQKKPSVVEMIVLAILFGFSVLTLSGLATFLYFNF